MTAHVVTHDPVAGRFEVVVAGATAELDHRRSGDRMIITHTGVPQQISRQGVASDLVAAAVAFAQDEHLVVDPRCWYAARWLERRPDVAATVAGVDRPA